jgi:hypothetical protein
VHNSRPPLGHLTPEMVVRFDDDDIAMNGLRDS